MSVWHISYGIFHRNMLLEPITRVPISWFIILLCAFYKYIKINIYMLGFLKNLIFNLFLFSSAKWVVIIDMTIEEEYIKAGTYMMILAEYRILFGLNSRI